MSGPFLVKKPPVCFFGQIVEKRSYRPHLPSHAANPMDITLKWKKSPARTSGKFPALYIRYSFF